MFLCQHLLDLARVLPLNLPLTNDFLSSRSVCLVVAPLISLMNDQVVSLASRGLSVASVRSDRSSEQLREIKEGKVKLVFGTPEAILNSQPPWDFLWST